MKDFKYKTIFSSTIKPLVSAEKDKYLAMASLMQIGELVPEIDTEKEIDLLPIAFNAAVVNRVNKNGDVIDTKTALAVYKSFINKPINIEHNRQRVIGTILSATFSEFGTDAPLTEEQATERTAPFNITLGGVVWKVVNNELTDMIEEASDPTSEYYQKISASWELGFSEFNLIILAENEKNIENGEVITDHTKIESLKANLKGFGGTGKTDDERYVYRQVVNDVVPLGIGLTENPAADVVGVAVKASETEEAGGNSSKTQNNISQPNAGNVNNNSTKDKIMKINNIKDIKDENLNELSASAITDFIEDELKKASEDFAAKKAKYDEQVAEVNQANDALSKEQEELKQELDKVQKQIEALEAEKAEKESQEKFNQRMASFDEDYVLDDEDRGVIASDIKDMSEKDFEGYSQKMAVLLSSKTKSAVEATEKALAEQAQTEETQESQNTAQEVVEEAVDQAETQEEAIPTSTEASEPTLFDKYKKAFSYENFETK
jgi:phage shock protein A